jgi:tetratricopeptide (TPR) repeat protein
MYSIGQRVSRHPFVVPIAAIFLLAGACSKVPSEAERLFQQAEQSFQQGRYAEARAALGRQIAAEPRNAKAFYLLGQIAEAQGDQAAALGYYAQTITIDNEHLDARYRAAWLFLALGDLDKAEGILGYVRDFRPNDVRLLGLEVAVLERRGNLAAAIPQAVKLLANEPSSVDNAILLAGLYGRNGERDKAEQVLNGALARNPSDTRLRFELAQNLIDQQRPREGEQILRDLIAAEPARFPYVQRLAMLYSSENRLDEAEELLRDAVRQDPSDERRLLILADFLANKRGPFLAEQELVNAIFSRPDSYSLRMALGGLYEQMLNLDGAEKVYREAADLAGGTPAALAARLRAADVLLRAGEAGETETELAKVLQIDANNLDALTLRGKLAMVRGEPEAAIGDFRTVLEKRPTSFEVLSMLVRAYVASGDADLAEQGLRRAIDVEPRHEGVRLELVQLLAVQNKLNDALAEVDKMLEVLPNNLPGLERKVDILLAQLQFEKAEAQARQIQDLYPNAITGYMQLGNIYFTQTRYDKAEEIYKIAVAQAPLDHAALQSLIQAMVMHEGLPVAQSYLEGFLKGYVNHPTAYNILGELYMQQNEHTKAEAAFARAYQLNPTWVTPYANLAKLYNVRGELEASVQVFLNGLAIVPDSIQLAMLLAVTYEQLGRDEDAADIYEGVLARRPKMDPAANNLALLLVKRATDPVARQRALDVVGRFRGSRSPLFRDTFAWVALQSGQPAQAQEVLEQLVGEYPNMPVLHYHLGVLYRDVGAVDKAIAELSTAVETRVPFKGFDDAERLLQELREKHGDSKQ